MNAKMILGATLLALVVLFTLQNTEVVALRFFWWEFAMSGVLMFLLIFALGLLTGFLLGSHRSRSARIETPSAGEGS
jgi:uncharacterized integral membrane protein